MDKKRFTNILLIGIVVTLLSIGGYFIWLEYGPQPYTKSLLPTEAVNKKTGEKKIFEYPRAVPRGWIITDYHPVTIAPSQTPTPNPQPSLTPKPSPTPTPSPSTTSDNPYNWPTRPNSNGGGGTNGDDCSARIPAPYGDCGSGCKVCFQPGKTVCTALSTPANECNRR